MRPLRDVRAGVALALVLVPALAGAAQNQAGTLPPIRPGTEVRVVTADGQELKGPVGAASEVRLVLQVGDGIRTLDVRQLRLVETVDDLKNGTLLGALLGGGLTVANPQFHSCGEDGEGHAGMCRAGMLLAGVAVGALVGAAIDGGHDGQRVLYGDGSSRTVRVRPWAAPGGVGVTGTITWR